MAQRESYLTPDGLKGLQQELAHLKRRPQERSSRTHSQGERERWDR